MHFLLYDIVLHYMMLPLMVAWEFVLLWLYLCVRICVHTCMCVCVLVCQGELKGSKLYNKLLEEAQHYYKSTVVSSTLVVYVHHSFVTLKWFDEFSFSCCWQSSFLTIWSFAYTAAVATTATMAHWSLKFPVTSTSSTVTSQPSSLLSLY